ncbi:MAG: hypothetical protein LBH18_07535 [Spirochaetaceae bacterium]|jgi:hypothetical protein|nr:hypothetical protein [Spirochaetaceae bacterium]
MRITDKKTYSGRGEVFTQPRLFDAMHISTQRKNTRVNTGACEFSFEFAPPPPDFVTVN